MKRLWLNVSFWTLYFLYSALAIPLLALSVAVVAPFVSHRTAMKRFRRAISAYGWVVIRILPYPWVKIRYEDLEPDLGPGPFLFVFNHRSSSDPFLLAVFPYEMIQVVNDWPFRLPVLGLFARWAGYLSIREMPPEEFFARTEKLLGEGVSLGAFPEGTRAKGLALGQFHGSIFRLALRTGAPIVPVCISGNQRMPPRGTLALDPGLIRMSKLPAVRKETYEGMSPFQLKNLVRRRIDEGLDRLEDR